MSRLLAALLVSVTFLAAGCLEDGSQTDAAKSGSKAFGKDGRRLVADLFAGPALWKDPQNAPHPAYGWPTLSSPVEGMETSPFWKPIPAAPLPKPIAGLQAVAQSPQDVRKAAGIAVFGSLVVVPGYGADTAVLDISDPAKPTVLSKFKQQEGLGNHRGATIIAYPDGRLVTVISTGTGLDVWDITNPSMPEGLPIIKPDAQFRSHKVGVIPGTPIVVNAASRGGGSAGGNPTTATGVTEMFDLSDPENPVRLPDFKNGYSCHHVYFWNDVEAKKFRGICAGSQMAQLWDTADPKDPKVIVSVPIPHGMSGQDRQSGPMMPWAHYAGLSIDGKILIVGDENGGGSNPPGCVAEVRTPAGSVSTPIGALWFYDVTNEKNPRLLGWYSPLNDPRVKAAPATSCTAHHGRIVPAEGRHMIAMSFYGAGVVLVDFTGIGTPGQPLAKVVDQFAQGSDTWETWYNQGYLFTGDLVRGVDVLKFK
ncbi:MAG TPA: hypothetical protein VI818_05875 [Candidatus Thermoplasmatota archaeon]|nr:hypothetical protein [Candidatus Thermoplasmatota archaeon]